MSDILIDVIIIGCSVTGLFGLAVGTCEVVRWLKQKGLGSGR